MEILRLDSLGPEASRLLLGLFVLCSAAILSRIFKSKKTTYAANPIVSQHRKSTREEKPYEIPVPAAYPDWSVETTKPLPYRPFRYGPKYFVTMGLRSIPSDEWIELDNHWPKYHADKVERIASRKEKVVNTHPDAYPAALELLAELVKYLPARYPTLFKRTPVGIDNLLTGESFNIQERPLAEDPMAICAKLVQDDLAIMLPRQSQDGTSQYHLLAGAICLAGFWRLSDKLGMSLSEIHTSGDVPHYKEKLHKGMASFFARLKCDQLYARNNYFIQVDDSLPWSGSIGDEDAEVVSWSTAEKDIVVEKHFFRSERQSLRRLPKTGAVVFTIRTYFHPITELAREDYVPGRLASAVRSWDEDVGNYKGREKYGKVLLEFLDKEHQKQLDRGLMMDEEEEVHKYPF